MAFKRSCALKSGVSIMTLVLVLSLRGVTADGPSWNHILSGTDWAGIAPENALCANGQKQSPVAIEDGSVVPASEPGALIIQWDSALIDFEVKNLGVTVEVDITGSNTLTVPPSIYSPPSTSPGLTLAQFHFHTPSEHMWNGEFFAAEVHFVHQDPVSKQRAVVGVFLALSPDDSDNPDLGTFFPQITKEYNSHSEPINNTLDLNKLLPDERSYYHLQGSLTTPPCSENILWFVMKNPIDISSSQLMTLQLAFAHGEGSKANNRPVQPLHGRTVTLYQGNAASCNPTSLLPNQCFNAAGTTFVCCPGGCPSSPSDVPACA